MVPRPAVPTPEKRRTNAATLAQLLTLSLALVTLAIVGLAVGTAILAAGSPRPQDWARLDLALVAGRYQACTREAHGPGAFGCLTAIGPRAPGSTTSQQRGVVYITTTVQEPGAPVAPPASTVRPSAPPHGDRGLAPNQAASGASTRPGASTCRSADDDSAPATGASVSSAVCPSPVPGGGDT